VRTPFSPEHLQCIQNESFGVLGRSPAGAELRTRRGLRLGPPGKPVRRRPGTHRAGQPSCRATRAGTCCHRFPPTGSVTCTETRPPHAVPVRANPIAVPVTSAPSVLWISDSGWLCRSRSSRRSRGPSCRARHRVRDRPAPSSLAGSGSRGGSSPGPPSSRGRCRSVRSRAGAGSPEQSALHVPYQPPVPGLPFNGPTSSAVIHPP